MVYMVKGKLYEYVRSVLQDYPATRSDDKKLVWQIWILQGAVKDGKITRDNFFEKAMMPSTITRARRLVQADYADLRATEGVQARRKDLASKKGTHPFRTELVLDSDGYQVARRVRR